MMPGFREINRGGVVALLCDADGNLFPSEEPAFVASAAVTNRFLEAFGVDRRYTPEELRLATTGKNFRSTAMELAVACGIPLGPGLPARYVGVPPASAGDPSRSEVLTARELDRWVAEEQREVTAYLAGVLQPDPEVIGPLTALAMRYLLAAVSSSATARLDACFVATRLAALFPEDRRFSAEDSLPEPTSKPDPAIYRFAGARLEIGDERALAVEDSVPGARSAVAAGFPTIGNVRFVPEAERPARIAELAAAGVVAVVSSWHELAELLSPSARDGTTASPIPVGFSSK
jgi:beta-phosphoglucomutase-like phosphatase (HAD superfamily)